MIGLLLTKKKGETEKKEPEVNSSTPAEITFKPLQF
jgi:hypothetical protein